MSHKHNNLLSSLNKYWLSFESYLFDRINCIETKKELSKNQFMVDTDYALKHMCDYQAVHVSTLRKIFRILKQNIIDIENFIDLGAGKGRACVYAALTNKFKKIIGVEFSPLLVNHANKNVKKFRNIKIIQADAADYEIPDGRSLIFLFNPFDEVVLKKFIENNIEKNTQNKNIIAYVNNIHKEIIESTGVQVIYDCSKEKISIYTFRK